MSPNAISRTAIRRRLQASSRYCVASCRGRVPGGVPPRRNSNRRSNQSGEYPMARLVVAAIAITMFLVSWMNLRTVDYARAFWSGGIGIAIVAFLVIHGRITRRRRDGEAHPAGEPAQGAVVRGASVAPEGAYAGGESPGLKRRRGSIVGATIAVAIFAGIAWMVSSPERTTAKVKVGMSREEVVAAVGRPAQWEGDALPECASSDLERCRNAKQSGAVRYLRWQTFVDSALIVGICKDGIVCFVAQEG